MVLHDVHEDCKGGLVKTLGSYLNSWHVVTAVLYVPELPTAKCVRFFAVIQFLLGMKCPKKSH